MFKLAAYTEVKDGSFISISEIETIQVARLKDENEINLYDSNQTIEIHDKEQNESESDFSLFIDD